jgi:hypothetical protein
MERAAGVDARRAARRCGARGKRDRGDDEDRAEPSAIVTIAAAVKPGVAASRRVA